MNIDLSDRLVALYHWLEPAIPWLTGAGIVMALVSMFAIPWLLVIMPEDYFVTPEREADRGALAWTLWILRNSLALVLVAAGIIMLVLPGQGLLTILIGVMCSNFPGKYRLERRLVRYPGVFHAINWIRERWKHPPIQYPHVKDDSR